MLVCVANDAVELVLFSHTYRKLRFIAAIERK